MQKSFEYAKILEKAGFTEKQVEAQIRVLDFVTEEEMAKKDDIQTLRSDIQTLHLDYKSDFGVLRAEFETFKFELKSDISTLRSEIESFKTEMKSEFKALLVKFESFNSEMKLGFESFTVKIDNEIKLINERLKSMEDRIVRKSVIYNVAAISCLLAVLQVSNYFMLVSK